MTKPAPTDPNGRKPTVAETRAAWEAHANPSLNAVLIALQQAGFTGTVRSTLDRWKKSGWSEERRRHARRVKPEDPAVIKQVTDKVADDAAAVEAAAALAIQTEIEVLQKLEPAPTTLDEAERIAIKIARIMVARDLARHSKAAVTVDARGAGKLLESLNDPMSSNAATAANVTLPPAEPKIVTGNIIEHDAGERPLTPLQQSIREFRSQQLKVVK